MEGHCGGVAHETLIALACKYPDTHVITLNQDQLFEDIIARSRSYRESGIGVRVTENEWQSRTQLDLLKIHGELKRPSTLAMRRGDTERLPDWKKDVLAAMLTDSILVFVGYSFRDRDVVELLHNVSPRRVYCIEPFVSQDFLFQRWALQEGLDIHQIGVSAEAAFSALCRELAIDFQSQLWSASEAEYDGAFRGLGDEWNHNPLREHWHASRVLGAGPHQDAVHQWTGGRAIFRGRFDESWQRRIREGSLAIHVPPGEGKGIHGGKGSTVEAVIRVDKKAIASVKYACVRRQHFQTYYAHDVRDKMPRRSLPKKVIAALRNAHSIEIEVTVPPRCCVDISGVSLQLRLTEAIGT